VDADGVVVPTSDALVRFTVEGPAHLLAVGNGDPTDHSPYQARERRAFHGRLLAMIQSTRDPGSVRVTARADGLAPAVIDFQAVPGEPPPTVR
jgi:beta-galactosidase